MSREQKLEILELLQNEWNNDESLIEFLIKISHEIGLNGKLEKLNDSQLFYQLKVRNSPKNAQIPGIQKDFEADFKHAILKARKIEP